MTDPLCNNCGYECDEVDTETGYCQTCERAYNIGYMRARKEYGD